MINRETAKHFLETRGYPNPECDYENELLDTLVEYAQQQAKNNEVLDLVSGSLPVTYKNTQGEVWQLSIERASALLTEQNRKLTLLDNFIESLESE